MTSAARRRPWRRWMSAAARGQPVAQRGVPQQAGERAVQLRVGEAVGVQAHAEPELVHPLGVVVLVPEQRQDDHGLAEVQALGGGVVAAVRDHQVGARDDRGLRQELRAVHVAGQLQFGVQRSLGHDVAVRGGRQAVDDPAHQGHVGRPQRAEREVDERPAASGQRLGQAERLVGLPDRGIQPVPARAERPGPPVVGDLRVDVQVGLAGVDEFQVRQGRGALAGYPVTELRPHRPVHPVVLGPELRPLGLDPAAWGSRRTRAAAPGRRSPAGCRRRS